MVVEIEKYHCILHDKCHVYHDKPLIFIGATFREKLVKNIILLMAFSSFQNANAMTTLKHVFSIQLWDMVFALIVRITQLVPFVINAKINSTEITACL